MNDNAMTGLLGGYGVPHTLEETARALGISRQRVKQIERRALEKLRAELKRRFGVTCVMDMT